MYYTCYRLAAIYRFFLVSLPTFSAKLSSGYSRDSGCCEAGEVSRPKVATGFAQRLFIWTSLGVLRSIVLSIPLKREKSFLDGFTQCQNHACLCSTEIFERSCLY